MGSGSLELILLATNHRTNPPGTYEPVATGPADPLTDRICTVLVDGDPAGLAGLYAPEALLDVNVPEWRFQVEGATAVAEAIREQDLGLPGRRVTSWRTAATNEGLTLEVAMRFTHDGAEVLARTLHLLRVANGRFAEHTVYCTGMWDQSTVSRQRREAATVVV
jgi:hypothetical protein